MEKHTDIFQLYALLVALIIGLLFYMVVRYFRKRKLHQEKKMSRIAQQLESVELGLNKQSIRLKLIQDLIAKTKHR